VRQRPLGRPLQPFVCARAAPLPSLRTAEHVHWPQADKQANSNVFISVIALHLELQDLPGGWRRGRDGGGGGAQGQPQESGAVRRRLQPTPWYGLPAVLA
jgi:hypothetical protein